MYLLRLHLNAGAIHYIQRGGLCRTVFIEFILTELMYVVKCAYCYPDYCRGTELIMTGNIAKAAAFDMEITLCEFATEGNWAVKIKGASNENIGAMTTIHQPEEQTQTGSLEETLPM